MALGGSGLDSVRNRGGDAIMKTSTKIVLTILAAVLYWWLVGCNSTQFEASDKKDHRPTDLQLANAFEQYNEAYFLGGLDSKTKVYLADLTVMDSMAKYERREGNQRVILIDRKSHPVEKQAEMSMLHEMCHEYDDMNDVFEGFQEDGHGNDAHESCMLMIAKRGAFKGLW